MIDLRKISKTITSPYGSRKDPVTGKENSFHYGIDLVLNKSDIPFVLGGTILESGYERQKGNYVKIKQTDGTTATYMHMKFRPTWKKGDTVSEGETVGVMGSTGNSTGVHLHYEVKTADGLHLDPAMYFDQYAFAFAGQEELIPDFKPVNEDESEYSLLGHITRFIVIFVICIAAVYLILKAFDIEIL